MCESRIIRLHTYLLRFRIAKLYERLYAIQFYILLYNRTYICICDTILYIQCTIMWGGPKHSLPITLKTTGEHKFAEPTFVFVPIPPQQQKSPHPSISNFARIARRSRTYAITLYPSMPPHPVEHIIGSHTANTTGASKRNNSMSRLRRNKYTI